MSDKKNEDYELRPSESFGEKDGFLARPPPRSRPALGSPISKIDNSPGAAILAYCFSSISMTVVNKYVVSGQFWNLNFLYLAVQVRSIQGKSSVADTSNSALLSSPLCASLPSSSARTSE